MNKRTIGVDFDGVIHSYGNGFGGEMTGPVPGAKEAIEKLIERGYEVIVFTARRDKSLADAAAWLRDNGFPPVEVTNKKPIAMAYIDDHAVRFTNWQDMLNYF